MGELWSNTRESYQVIWKSDWVKNPKFIPYNIKNTETNDIIKEQIEIRYYGVETGDQILLSISKENKKFDRINHYDGAPYENIFKRKCSRCFVN